MSNIATSSSIDLSTIDGLIYKIEYDLVSAFLPYYFGARERLDVLEIGSYKGKSTLMFLQAYPNTHITCVEPFCGPPEAPHLRDPGLRGSFLANTASYRNQITLLEKRSDDPTLRADLSSKMFDVCFIDGDHSYEAVCNDIELCLAHLRPDGLLLIDDFWIHCDPTFKFYGVYRAVTERLMYKYKFLCLARSVAIFQHNTDYLSYAK
jgi:predicted O-methyltransferase YrrM